MVVKYRSLSIIIADMKKFLSRRNIILLVIAGLLLGGWWYQSKSKSKSKDIRTAEVTRGTVEEVISVSGEVKAENKAILNFPVPGKLGYVKVSEGQKVVKGQALMGLDSRDIAVAEVAAYYNYLAADANAKEVEDSVKDHDKDETFAQKNDRVAAQTARDKAYDAWQTAKRAYINTSLVAPFAGVVTSLTTTVAGDTVGVTDGLTVVDPQGLYFEIEVDESDIGKIKPEQPVQIKLDAFAGEQFEGKLDKIGFEARLSTTGATVFPVWVVFPETAMEMLRLGMNGDAEIVLQKRENVLNLPIEAIVDGEVTLAGELAQTVKVETGLESDTEVEITSGLQEGAEVVIK